MSSEQRDYITRHDIPELLNDACTDLIDTRPENPAVFLIDYLAKARPPADDKAIVQISETFGKTLHGQVHAPTIRAEAWKDVESKLRPVVEDIQKKLGIHPPPAAHAAPAAAAEAHLPPPAARKDSQPPPPSPAHAHAGAHARSSKSVVRNLLRYEFGLTTDRVDESKKQLYKPDFKPSETLSEALQLLDLQDANNYWVCPKCRVITGNLTLHCERLHPGFSASPESTPHPTIDDVLRLAFVGPIGGRRGTLDNEAEAGSMEFNPTKRKGRGSDDEEEDETGNDRGGNKGDTRFSQNLSEMDDLQSNQDDNDSEPAAAGEISGRDSYPALTVFTMDTEITSEINKACIDPELPEAEKWRPLMFYLNAELKRLPVAKVDMVYRGVSQPINALMYSPGSVVTWHTFISATTNPDLIPHILGTDEHHKKVGSLFVIYPKTARSVRSLSTVPDEEELIFPPNTQFRVRGLMAEGSKKLLGLATGSDLSQVAVYELDEVYLMVWRNVLAVLTPSEALRNPELVAFLRKYGPFGVRYQYMDGDKRTPLHIAAMKEGNVGILPIVLACGVNVNALDENKCSALHYAIQSNDGKMACYLANRGADIAGITPQNMTKFLRWAMDLGDEALAKRLEAAGAKKDDKAKVVEEHQSNIMDIWEEVTIMASSDVKRLPNVLLCASARGYADVVSILIKEKADINASDENGINALMYSFKYSHIDCASVLMENNIPIKPLDKNGMTALLHAVEHGHTASAKTLLSQGANVNTTDSGGNTALMIALKNGHGDLAEMLIKQGANVNATSHTGCTPLMFAAKSGMKELAQTLLDKGAELNACDKDGMMAMTYATKSGHKELSQMLVEIGKARRAEARGRGKGK